MLERNSDKEWQRYGREDPYYGVISDERFHREKLTPEALQDFFRTGEDHAEFVLTYIRRRLAPEFAPRRVLDFGCGVGRCAIALARHSESVLGVDVSESMIEEARHNASAMSVGNASFAVSDGNLSEVTGPFDLVHSFIVFQHVPFRKGEALIRRLIELLADDGVAALHFLYFAEISRLQGMARWLRKRVPPLHWAANLAYGKPLRYPLMEKNVYDLNRLFFLLHQYGCRDVVVRLSGRYGLYGIIVFFHR